MTDTLNEIIARAIAKAIWNDAAYAGADVAARAVRAAINASGTHRVVPVEPTAAMMVAGGRRQGDDEIWMRMLAAVPRAVDDG